MTHYVYILECKSNRFYTGYTTDLARRYQEHLEGSPKCKFTRSFPPIKIAACWEVSSRSIALKMEYHIKKLSKKEKRALIDYPDIMYRSSTLSMPDNVTDAIL